MIKNSKIIPDSHLKIDSWFDDFINKLQIDKFLLKEDIASTDTKMAYELLMSDDKDGIMSLSREISSMHFIEKLIIEYLKELKKSKAKFNKLAFDLGNSKLLSWVEINDNDEDSEDKLIMAEAKINAKFDQFGFYISTTIIEKSDNIPVPAHYNLINLES